jgi:hypothetical protein
MGSAVAFLASEDDPLFRGNANIVVEERRNKEKSLDQLGDQAVAHLSFLLNEYELLSRAPSKLGNLTALELRGRYRGPEGARIIRTIVGLSEDMHYIATFSCREDREETFQKSFEVMRASFQAIPNLSR